MLGWEVYQEVRVRAYGATADIVATQGPVDWIIETKTTRSMKVLEQAYHWRGRAHRVSVAVPSGKGDWFFQQMCQSLNIGYIKVFNTSMHREHRLVVEQEYAPMLRRIPENTRIRNYLEEEHKTFAEAGSQSGGAYTPFQATAKKICQYVTRNPGCTLKDAIEGVRHHYAHYRSARGALASLIRLESVRAFAGIEAKVSNGKIYLYPKEEEDAKKTNNL